LNWSGLPVVHVRPTVFLQHFFFLDWAAESIAKGGTIRLPFGSARTSPIDTQDVRGLAAEYAEALGRPIAYVDVPFEQWRHQELRPRGLWEHVYDPLLRMAKLPAANRYDRLTHDVEAILGRPATSARDFVARHAESFAP